MKKTLLLAIMCVFALLGNVNAQVTVEIGTDKNLVAGNYYLPTYDYSKYSVSQQIYTEEEFDGNLGSIKSVAFKLSNVGKADNRQYEIYMKHAEDVSSQVAISADDKVFDGEVTMSNIMNTWITIPFDKAFDYAGGNVMICVYDKTGTSAGYPGYHTFYTYATDSHRARYFQSPTPIDLSNMKLSNCPTPYICQVRFEMEAKSIVKVEPEAIDLGEVMLGNYWGQEKKSELNAKVVATTITDIKVDNDFFVIPAMEDIDFTADPVVIEVSYNKNASVDGIVNGNITISYEDTEVVVPVTANAYTPGEADVWELAKEIVFENNTYKDTPEFDKLHDNYLLPRESANAVTPDVVYSFELEEETILRAKVEGTNAKMAIYNEGFEGKGGPSNDNNTKGNILITSEFFFDFNEDVLTGWTVKNSFNNANNWEITKNYGVDSTNCVSSASFKSGSTGTFMKADNYLTTEKTYYITENSKLSFEAMNQQVEDVLGNYYGVDRVWVKVSKDGENMIPIEEITPGNGVYETKVIDLGAKFAELGLECSDYHIVLHHKEDNKFNVLVDNIRLTSAAQTRGASNVDEIYAVEYPAGKYYLVAAAEDQISFEISILNADELPATPANVVATTIDEFSIELTWEAAERATSYNIYRNEEFLVNVTETSYLDENLDSDVDYCYVVRAYNDIMESVDSEKACAKTKKVVLTPPTEISATATSVSTIVLTWSKVEKVGGYKIYWGEEVVDIVTDTTYTVEGLAPSTEYCYMVSSVYKNRESFDKSAIACETTLAIVPAVPSNVKVEATSEASVKVSWDAAENAERYYIYNADTLVAKTTYTFYNIVGLTPNTEYCYTVVAVNGEIESDKSDIACGKTLESEVGIDENTSSFNIYPNPVNDKLYIETEAEVREVVVYDVYGRQQDNKTTRQQESTTVDVTGLNSGVYFVKVVTGNGEVVKRFIKK